jgi:hypothetical protein
LDFTVGHDPTRQAGDIGIDVAGLFVKPAVTEETARSMPTI